MKLRDAEMLLQAVKAQGPLKEPWSCLTDEGIMLEAWPLGFARGSIGLSEAITMFTENPHFSLYEGAGEVHKFPRWSPRKMWQQEMFVYLREMREAFNVAFKDFERAPFLPRPGETGVAGDHSAHAPVPEDFNLYPPPQDMVRWTLEGQQNVSDEELARIKRAFCKQLGQFCVTTNYHHFPETRTNVYK
jgi:hypothetical protein